MLIPYQFLAKHGEDAMTAIINLLVIKSPPILGQSESGKAVV